MYTLFSLPFLLPTFYTLQMMALCGLANGPSRPTGRDTFLSDLESAPGSVFPEHRHAARRNQPAALISSRKHPSGANRRVRVRHDPGAAASFLAPPPRRAAGNRPARPGRR